MLLLTVDKKESAFCDQDPRFLAPWGFVFHFLTRNNLVALLEIRSTGAAMAMDSNVPHFCLSSKFGGTEW